jgi:ABC-2 type transport system permease protein
MTVWRLEWLRLVRTHRLLAIVAGYVFFGLTGPLTARYLGQILGRLGTGGIQVSFPPPQPADGMDQYIGNASQLGLLVVVLVAASALAFDARTEMAVFLRSRVAGVGAILLPAYVCNAAVAIGGLLAGTLAAWYETAVLLGPLPVGRMLLGAALGALFLAFAVALTAFTAALARGTLAGAGGALLVLLLMAVLAGFGTVGRWLPTTLSGAVVALVRGAAPGDYLPAAVVTAAATGLLLVLAVTLAGRREL